MNKRSYINEHGHIILWLLTIPEGELSESMLAGKRKLKNDISFVEFLEKELIDEIAEFAEWNNEMAYSV